RACHRSGEVSARDRTSRGRQGPAEGSGSGGRGFGARAGAGRRAFSYQLRRGAVRVEVAPSRLVVRGEARPPSSLRVVPRCGVQAGVHVASRIRPTPRSGSAVRAPSQALSTSTPWFEVPV